MNADGMKFFRRVGRSAGRVGVPTEDRGKEALDDALRISVGTDDDIEKLLTAMKDSV